MQRKAWTVLGLGALAVWLPFANDPGTGAMIGGRAGAVWAFAAVQLRSLLGIFVDHPGLGRSAGTDLGAAPVYAIVAALQRLGIGSGITVRALVALAFFIGMLGAYRLGRSLLGRRDDWIGWVVPLAGAVFYGVNHTSVQLLEDVPTVAVFGYSALPWLAVGVLRGAAGNRRSGIIVVACALLCAGSAALGLGPLAIALVAVVVGVALALADGSSPRAALGVAIGGCTLGLGLGAWWLLPALGGLVTGFHHVPAAVPQPWRYVVPAGSALAAALRLAQAAFVVAEPYAPWYVSPVGAILGAGPLLAAVAGLGLVRSRLAATGAALFVVSAVIAAFAPPFDAQSDWIRPWLQIEALTLLVIYVLGLAGVLERLTRPPGVSGNATAIVALALSTFPLLAYPWPAFSGAALATFADQRMWYFAQIPDDYTTASGFLRAHANGRRALVLNAGQGPLPMYTWGYFGVDPLVQGAGIPITGPDVLPRAAVASPQSLERTLDALGVAYLVVHDDLVEAAPGANIDALVRSGAARLILRTADLRVYERAKVPATANAISSPALIRRVDGDGADLRLDPTAAAQLVPGVSGSLFGDEIILAGDAKTAPQWLGTVGEAGDIDSRGAAFGVLNANPLAASFASARCGRGPALRMLPPSVWTFGGARPATLERIFCLRNRWAGIVTVDGAVADPSTNQLTLPSAIVHRMKVTESARHVALNARALPDDSLVFSFVAPFGFDLVTVHLPPALARTRLFAGVDAADETLLGSGSSSGTVQAFTIPLVVRHPIAGERCFLDLRGNDRALLPLVRSVGSIQLDLDATIDERLSFALDPALGDARPLTRAQAYAAPTVSAGGNKAPLPESRRLFWTPASGAAQNQPGARGAALDVRAHDEPLEMVTGATLRDTDRYRLRLDYVARGTSRLRLNLDGYVNPRVVSLIADGSEHRTDLALVPPTGSSGALALNVWVASGSLHLRAEVEAIGANALVYGLRAGSASGSVISAERPAPWRFRVVVEHCAPCLLGVAVGSPDQWLVLGARRIGTFEREGQSGGQPWSGDVTGAASFAVDAGQGRRTVDLVFVPAILAALGLLGAFGSLGAAFVVLPRLSTASLARGDGYVADGAAGVSWALRLAGFAFVAAAVPIGTALAGWGDLLGWLACMILAALALRLWWQAWRK